MIVIALSAAGVAVGTMIAVLLERLYTGAAWRGPILPCSTCHQSAPGQVWLGPAGWLLLRGRCPACGDRIPLRLLYLPLLGSAAFGVAAALVGGRHLLLVLGFTPSLLALTAADIERRLLPNRIMYPTLLAAIALCWAWPERSVVDVLAGGVAGFAIMLLLYLILPGFGFGDVKLAALLGLLSGLANVAAALTVGAIAAGLGSLILLALGRVRLKSMVAYGPYLALGALLGMLAGG